MKMLLGKLLFILKMAMMRLIDAGQTLDPRSYHRPPREGTA